MTYLLDVNVILAAIWTDHENHARADAWLYGKKVALCPITELGFLRISAHPRALNVSMEDAKKVLQDFWRSLSPQFVADSISPHDLHFQSGREVTDIYLAELAARNSMKLATMDRGISHKAVELLPL